MPPKRKAAAKGGSPKKQAKLTAFVSVTGADGKAKKSPPRPKTAAELNLTQYITEPSWVEALKSELSAPYFAEIESFLAAEYGKGKEIFPPPDLIFSAFNAVPITHIRVVILGQDPYHDNNQAHGLCFSVQKGVAVPPSLKNVYKELGMDVAGFAAPPHGHLQGWADQGVFLPNATLTVEAHKANSHAKIGWQKLTDAAISAVSHGCAHVVFILWGGFAHKKEKLIDPAKHTIIKNAHPSPLSVTKFLGCKCFSKTNAALKSYGLKEIDWHLK